MEYPPRSDTRQGPASCSPHPPIAIRPPRIPRRALQLATDPTAAWQVIQEAQQPRTLPLEHFTRPPLQKEGAVRFVVVSDTHNAEARHGIKAEVPEGDVPI